MRNRFNISKYAIKYSWLTLIVWLIISIAGVFAFSSLKYALFPDVTFPVVVVNASARTTSQTDTEARITNALEQKLQGIEGVSSMRSSTYSDRSVISLGFDVGTNLEASTQKVEEIVKQVKLPDNATFQVIPINLNETAAVSYTFTYKASPSLDYAKLQDLTTLAKTRILPKLQALEGVLKVSLLGAPTPLPTQISPQAFGEFIKNTFTSTKIRINGKDALAMEIIKRSSANTLEVVDLAETAVEKLRSQFPDLEISLASTQAEYIKEATHATIDSLVLAVILSVVVIYPFLKDWKATVISALAIPMSLLGTFVVMAIMGFNLETITLLALALVIGIVVDDAIVDVENISRHLDQGESPFRAAITATREIGLTVTAATLTIAAVFLPVGLMQGTLGQFFKPFGITVSAAVLISLAVARTLSPLLAAYWLKGKPWEPQDHNHRDGMNAAYAKILIWSLNHRWLVVGLAILTFIIGLALLPYVPKAFIPKLDRGEFNITYTGSIPKVAAPPVELFRPSPNVNPASLLLAASPLVQSGDVAKQLEASILKSPEVETVFTTIGNGQGQPNRGNLYVKLRSDRTLTTSAMQDQLRATLPRIQDVTTSIEDIQFVDTGGEKPLQISLVGENLENLRRTAIAIKAKIQNQIGLEDIKITGDSEVDHLNGKRVTYITANLGKNIALGTATDQVVAIAKPLLPAGVIIDLGGDSGRLNAILNSFAGTLSLSVTCIAFVLLCLFRNLVDPLLVVFSLPLALVGAILSLLITNSGFGMIAVIGIILLIGIANKNAILIVDYINQSREQGLTLKAAILAACPVRLRPILMTTASTVLGMLPIALGIGAGSELRAPMAIAVIGGLITSTVLSLIFVPVVYSLLDVFRKKVEK
ncbi:cation/multidrug efflux pump [Synechococcus sp. PCC 7502]|uniref:efflux RND transporter permease subunit n=1 Tax=Synechococcus sp. PCC 7502 TaxID=1173263 RepID=UPI00029F97D6|nr:efflux RND transporter permease subunit [Synechococcus sp. PCC 7502]AFY74386.1 cation/multidrug efflux pump [Synechococcus sp. PCC 7502]